ncbi:MAG: threonine/serine dehydratase [Pseudomonadota bacterium]
MVAAARRLQGLAVTTPLISCPALDDRTGARVFLKAESLQRTGSFKFRGAYNTIAMLSQAERSRGVVAASSGNHAQGVAEAARLFAIPATIAMPDDAPAVKRERTARSGAKVVLCPRGSDARYAIAHEVAQEEGATFIHPYDDARVMAGQGTVGLEIAAALQAMGLAADRVIVPTSGGGLLSGIATALAERMPGAVCVPAEPAGFDDMTRSLEVGTRVENAVRTGSIADALLSPMPGEKTFPNIASHVAQGAAVSDDALRRAMAFAADELKLVLEPGGAIALAALLDGLVGVRGMTVVAVLSGGNVDKAAFADAIAHAAY